MEITWRLPHTWERQPAVHMILHTQSFTPWHHPRHGSNWLRLQTRGAWTYGDHELADDRLNKVYGWRKALAMINTGNHGPREMRSAIENHMSKEDLGPEVSERDWSDLETLQNQLEWWEETIYTLGHPGKERNRWSQIPPMRHDWGKSQKERTLGPARQGKKKVSCFHASTRVMIFKTDKGISEYKRMDKLVKGDKLWTRRFWRNNSGPGQGHVSIVECVMTCACQPDGQSMVEVKGIFLTLDHYVSRVTGPWTTAGEQTQLESEPQVRSASIVYNIKLQEGDHIELGNRIYAATLGARFDVTGPEEEPTYSEEDARYLQGLPEYSSGRIHLAFGTAAVDLHGTPTPEPKMGLPSRAGTTTLLDKDILKIILCTQQAEQG